jgi:hypothetical protein
MTTMGRHSPPIDGAIANGHQLVPLAPAVLRKLGPVSALPQQDAPGQARTGPGRRGRRTIDGDTVIRVLAAIVVLAVAAFAAIVSYSHIFELGRHHGQDGTAARLLPLSVDGLIAAASLVMLHAARRKLDVPQLARWMLALGVGATVAANVEYGMPFGWLSAVVSAWPAVAFVGSVEMAVRFVRDARADMTDDERARPGQPGKNGGEGTGLAGSLRVEVAAVAAPAVQPSVDRRADKQPDSRPDKPGPSRTVPPRTALDKAAAVIMRHPDWTDVAVAKSAGVSTKTVQRARNGKTGSKP